MKILFWVAAALVVYTYFGYPFVLWVFARVRSRGVLKKEFYPSVSIIIAARNEADRIRQKIDHTLTLDYPVERREILVASDASDDATDEIVKEYGARGVKLVRAPLRRGKESAQGLAISAATGDILVFTDAATILEPDALWRLMTNFADSTIGAVSTEDLIVDAHGNPTAEGLYVRYEMWVRRLEGRFHSLVGLSGSCFAIRKELCSDWSPVLASDFMGALRAARNGYRSISDPSALGRFVALASPQAEMRRKIRTFLRGITVLMANLDLLNPLRHGRFAFQLASHKLLRFVVPFLLLTILTTNAFLTSAPFYASVFGAQVGLYLLAGAGGIVRPLQRSRIVRTASFFVMVQWAMLRAWVKYALGQQQVTWEPSRRDRHTQTTPSSYRAGGASHEVRTDSNGTPGLPHRKPFALASPGRMRKILIVSYHFPPDAAVGGMRPAKFAKYLPQFGWEPIILTVKERYYPVTDQSKLKNLGPVPHVYRTRMLPRPGSLYMTLKSLLGKATRGPANTPIVISACSHRGALASLRRALGSLEYLPDDKQIWIPLAVATAAHIIRRHNVDAFLTTGPPMTCHVIGLLLKAVTRRRWIADFRDPWIVDHEESAIPSTAFSRAVEAWLEKKTMLNADSVVLNTDRAQAYLHLRYPFLTKKSAVILNGYDPVDFSGGPNEARQSDQDTFTLTHTGTIYQKRSAELLLHCLSDLVQTGTIPRKRVRVNFVGSTPTVRERATQLDLADIVTVIDFMKYEECVELLHRSDVLLLFAQGQPLQIPTKLYDYIAVGKSILVFAEDGATADLASRVPGATVVGPEDGERLKAKLKELFTHFQRGELAANEPSAGRIHHELTKQELTRKLVRLLN